ncbi:MAG TPA: hypothetical protein VFX21_05960 [Acidimicrobiia bacterium]|nr:hypothetical protein [Acidimicrobiia bacterium]
MTASVCALSVLLVLFALGDIYVSPQNDRVDRYGGTGTSRRANGQPFATFDEPPVQQIFVQAIARRTTSSTTTSTSPTTAPGAPTTTPRGRGGSPVTEPRIVAVTSPSLGSSTTTTTTVPRPAIPPLPSLPPLPPLPVLPVSPSLPTNKTVAPMTIPTTTSTSTSTTTIPPAPVTLDATLSLSVSAIPAGPYDINSDAAPRLSWSTVDATQASVSGLGVVSLDLSGTVTLCPGVVTDNVCTPMANTYDYTLTARDDLGHTVTRTVTLVVG